MNRKIPGYVTIAEVAQDLGVKPATVRRYLHKKDLPEPDSRAGQSPLWREDTIERWKADRASASWNRKK
ncbi:MULTISPECIES: helix-turn-helix transcriptional regulator [unclassified Nocardiopsis]|uniref:helix-turn-helix transcriptional regulator n=1 Tax=Nocardiopsis TaxID=2013 RepID=UPI00387AC003